MDLVRGFQHLELRLTLERSVDSSGPALHLEPPSTWHLPQRQNVEITCRRPGVSGE